jgi:hypothetical protein
MDECRRWVLPAHFEVAESEARLLPVQNINGELRWKWKTT